MENLLYTTDENRPIEICYFGEETCEPNHFHGPAIRDEYLLHYVISGQGSYIIDDHKYVLRAGQGFFIPPHKITYYQADEKDPWHYTWVGFKGSEAKRLISKTGLGDTEYIFSCGEESDIRNYFKKMEHIRRINRGREERLIGLTYQILGCLIQDAVHDESRDDKDSNQLIYLKEAIMYIRSNYYKPLSISDVASYLAIDRSYLFMIFKQQLNISPKTYLMHYRFNKASHLLISTSLTVNDISFSIGYKDPLTFSKAFKKHFNLSPRHYRQKYIHLHDITRTKGALSKK